MSNTTINTRLVFLFTVFGTEGLFITATNLAIVLTVACHESLRSKKGYIVIAGLAFGDLLNGLGLAFAGPHRVWLEVTGRVQTLVTNWDCMMRPYSWLWVYGQPLASVMMTCVSVDRFLAVSMPIKYFKFTRIYAIRLVGGFYAAILVFGTAGVVVAYRQPVVKQYKPYCFTDYALVDSVYRTLYWKTITLGGVVSVGLYAIVYYLFKKKKAANMSTAITNSVKQQRKLLVTLAISSSFTAVFFALPSLAILMFAGSVPAQTYAVIAPVAGVLKNVNPILNFFLYVTRHEDLKKGFLYMIKCKDLPPGV